MAGSAVSTSASGGPGRQPAPPGGTIPPSGRPPPAGKSRPRRFTTPATLRLLLVATIAGCLAWGALAAVAVAQHAGAASNVITSSEPLSLDAQQLYRSLSDADVTVSTGYLAGSQEPLAAQQRYTADIAQATSDLTAVSRAGAGPQAAASLTTLTQDLPVYVGYVSNAETYNSVGLLAGASYTEAASEEMRQVLLPAARAVYAAENARLNDMSAQASGLPLMLIVVVAALALGYLLVGAQRWLARRTHRRLNPGLLLATAVGAVALVWLVVAFAVARADLLHANAQGSGPAETLAQAEITAQQARGDETMNLVSRTGDAVFQQDFAARLPQLDALLASAAGSSGPAGAHWAAAARSTTAAWYAVNQRVHELDVANQYTAETQLVTGTAPGTAATQFATLDSDISAAITADQAVFRSSASAGSSAFGGLEVGVIVAAAAMAAGASWGLSRRLAEYR
jgi:hypothetical protein